MKGLELVTLKRYLIAFLVLFSPLISSGQDVDLGPVTNTYVLKNVNIIQAPGRKIDMGMILVENGVIASVGKTVSVPVNARIIDADSMYVYAGFIDGMSHAGVPKPQEQDRVKIKDPGNPPNDLAGVQPQLDVRDMLSHEEKSLKALRETGFTAAHVVPYGKMLPGNGAIILLSGQNVDDLVMRDHTSLYSQLKGASGMYPATVIGVMAKYRELYQQSQQAKSYQARYNANSSGMERPNSNRVLEAFYPVIDKKIPVVFEAESVLDIQRVLALKKDLGFNLMLGEVKQAWDIADQIKASGASILLSLDLPEIEEEKVDSTKDESTSKTAAQMEEERLQKRKDAIVLRYYQQPTVLKSKGLQFGFSTSGVKAKNIKGNLVKLVDNGLSTDDALAALTTTPARLLGVSNVMGTIDAGKMANLIVVDKPYFQKDSKVRYVFIDGKIHELEVKSSKKGKSDGKDIDPTGVWSYSTETPQGTSGGKMTIKGQPGNYSGTVTSTFSGGDIPITSISMDGARLSLTFDIDAGGNTIAIELSGNIDGDDMEGTMTAGQFGSFPFEAQRAPKR